MEIKGTAAALYRAAKSCLNYDRDPDFNDRAYRAAENVNEVFWNQSGGSMQGMQTLYVSLIVDEDIGVLMQANLVAQQLTKD